MDQLSAMRFLLGEVECYADFAILGPRGNRMLKKLRMKGMVFGRNGELTPVQIDGPPTHHLRLRCWNLYVTCMIPHRAGSLGGLNSCMRHIGDYHDRYGSECWHLSYQADARFRSEHLERLFSLFDRYISSSVLSP